MTNETLKTLSAFNTSPPVNPLDLKSLHYYRDAAKMAYGRAQREEVMGEKLRLLEKAKWHLQKVDRILEKYEEDSQFTA